MSFSGASILTLTIAVPSAGTTTEINVGGQQVVILSAPDNSDPSTVTLLHPGNVTEAGGLPVLERMQYWFQDPERIPQRFIIEGQGDSGTVLMLVISDFSVRVEL